eukprot:CAMPEP_0174253190 /NCGR_PEP_ID=MMETSP0439-20130205/2582_1 /TAXON_ID=0 /ORGANISM="Stereomyxa ramosa, Strain Chinc5" /LENGTH=523 /DNA_ID=CAMNT_0015334093 /DNA_START=282 /DNA_END=1853 /DNA_ORIENTATION=-
MEATKNFSIPQNSNKLETCLEDLSLSQINSVMDKLKNKKKQLKQQEQQVDAEVLFEFLTYTKKQKLKEMEQLKRQLEIVERDIKRVSQHWKRIGGKRKAEDLGESKRKQIKRKKRKMLGHIGGLQTCYFEISKGLEESCGASSEQFVSTPDPKHSPSEKNSLSSLVSSLSSSFFETDDLKGSRRLSSFTEKISNLVRWSKNEVVATIRSRNSDFTDVVSSIEFDRDAEFFAVGGMCRKLKIFEFDRIISDPTVLHFPVQEINVGSRIASLGWNPYIKSQLGSAGYDSKISIWDASTAQASNSFEGHDKRVWAIEFCPMDPSKLISSSDDAKVKLWSIGERKPITTIEAPASVCSVAFAPNSCTEIAFGSADHNIYVYDLRQTKQALEVLMEHDKAVSYVKFMSCSQLVSASTDSTLKLWDFSKVGQKEGESRSIRTFRDHTNKCAFVGLDTTGQYITTGSETNTLYTYYAPIPNSLFTYSFEGSCSEGPGTGATYISACTYKKHSNYLVAANSGGGIKVLKMA